MLTSLLFKKNISIKATMRKTVSKMLNYTSKVQSTIIVEKYYWVKSKIKEPSFMLVKCYAGIESCEINCNTFTFHPNNLTENTLEQIMFVYDGNFNNVFIRNE